jgi:hypothetical protein
VTRYLRTGNHLRQAADEDGESSLRAAATLGCQVSTVSAGTGLVSETHALYENGRSAPSGSCSLCEGYGRLCIDRERSSSRVVGPHVGMIKIIMSK